MARLSAITATLLIGAFAALGLAACGGGADLLPGTTADEIKTNLDTVKELADSGDCIGAEEATLEVAVQIDEELEELEVDPELREALSEGVERLSRLVAECQEGEEESEPLEDEELEEQEKRKPDKEKPQPEEPEGEEGEEAEEEGEGEGEEAEEGESPSEQEESSSGGVSPGEAVEGE